ncbi:LacI family transcriptional regulator [candidate division KSB3 bacterium]|uniref:LacI family transcriptional regulator n=1 Tax=candidate division KSB3 bacterium TaxID=2044937 RepID=A0A2G6KC65_9BACT|nr:MAG: LacI family transcriptional regulator [candidate division KSB3 bacterium]
MKKQRKQVRLHDIAIKAGVSVNTVSRALRDKSDVNEVTRQRILNLAQKLGYVFPESTVPSRKTLAIGVLIQDILNPFYARVMQGIESILWQHQAKFIFQCSYRQESKERDILAFFNQEAVDGLLVTSVMNPEYVLDQLQALNIPTVFLSQRFERYDVDYVVNDNFEGALMATEHLIKLGHTRIAHIAGLDSQFSTHERLRGYRAALEQAGIATDNHLLRSGDNTIDSGYYLMKDLLQSERPLSAAFVYNDLMTLGAFRAIKEAELRVPADISIVGYDDILFAGFFDVPLTTVHQPIQEIARKAAEILFEKIRTGLEYAPQSIVLTPRLTVRSSTSICPQS